MNVKKLTCPLCKTTPCSCDTSNNKNNIITISAPELKKKIEQKSDLMVINVLNEKFYRDCHIKGSTHIPLNRLKSEVLDWDKNQEIIVYCANYMCTTSSAAFKILQKMGFKNIASFEGGMKEWKDKNFSYGGPCVLDYLKIITKTNE